MMIHFMKEVGLSQKPPFFVSTPKFPRGDLLKINEFKSPNEGFGGKIGLLSHPQLPFKQKDIKIRVVNDLLITPVS
jgi:hypothetical protein